jgi:Family of unknown function (DUF6999)
MRASGTPSDLIANFERTRHDPNDPDPWLALYLDTSLPLPDEVKAALLANSSSRSRQFLLPLVRPFSKALIILFQVLKIVIPNRSRPPRSCTGRSTGGSSISFAPTPTG